jgi:hypothetical protein
MYEVRMTLLLVFILLLLQSPGKIFKIKFFFSLPGEVFLIKNKKKSFYEKFAGRQQYFAILLFDYFFLRSHYDVLGPWAGRLIMRRTFI